MTRQLGPWTKVERNDTLLRELRAHQDELERQNQELRQSQRLLEKSRRRYADLYDGAPIGYCTLDRQGCILESNAEAAKLLGRATSELAGATLTSIVTIADPAQLEAHLERCFDGWHCGSLELAFATDGGRVVVEMNSTPIFGPWGEVVSCKTTLTDVTALKTSEERLRVLSETSEALASSLDYSITLPTVAQRTAPLLSDVAFFDVCEEDGRVLRFMPGAPPSASSELRAGDPQAWVLATGQPLLAPECPAETLALALADGTRATPPGASAGGSLLLVPLTAGGKTLGVLTCIRHASAQRYSPVDQALAEEVAARAAIAIDHARLYRLAQRAIRAREEVVAIVSHDLRNPLHAIRLHCEQLLTTLDDSEPSAARPLAAIKRGVGNMERLISDLLDLSRIEAGQLWVSSGECDAAALALEAVERARPLAEEKQLGLALSLQLGEARVRCDRERILQVLGNLLGNAIKFTPARGTVALEAARVGELVRLLVRDSGPGIAAEQLPHVFDRYWRADEAHQRGTGLGLYIAKGIVAAHGSELEITSAPGAGTTLVFTLPLSS